MHSPRQDSTSYNVEKLIIQRTVYIIVYFISMEKSYFHLKCVFTSMMSQPYRREKTHMIQYWPIRLDFLSLMKDLKVLLSALFYFVYSSRERSE